MNFNKLISIRRGCMFKFDRPSITTIKRSPSEYYSCLHEHQYGEKYVLSYETDAHIYFAILKNGIYQDCKWRMEKETFHILIYIKTRFGESWERYAPGEYVIKML